MKERDYMKYWVRKIFIASVIIYYAGGEYKGIEIIDFNKLVEISKDYTVVLATTTVSAAEQIREQLVSANISYVMSRDILSEIRKKKYEEFSEKSMLIPIQMDNSNISLTKVSDYWTTHTVRDDWFASDGESIEWRKYIIWAHPYQYEFLDMGHQHPEEVILDYGCGPGNDLVWYTQTTKARKVIGVDVSKAALENAQFRLALHGVTSEKCSLIKIDENIPQIPIVDKSVDFVSCQGVLQHTSYPLEILKEFYRVIKGGRKCGDACIMVYNKNSIWYHLYAAYYLRFINCKTLFPYTLGDLKGMDVDEIFAKSTDGVDCPLARCWKSQEFEEMCKSAGFTKVKYMGGYSERTFESELVLKYLGDAIKDARLEEEHKEFLRKIRFDEKGYPKDADGFNCGVAGVYWLWK